MVQTIETEKYKYTKGIVPEDINSCIIPVNRDNKPTKIIIRLIPFDETQSHIVNVLGNGIGVHSLVSRSTVYNLVPIEQYGSFCRSNDYSFEGNKIFGKYASGLNERQEVLSPDIISLGIGICLERGQFMIPETLISVTSVIADYIIKYDLDIDPMNDIHDYNNMIPNGKIIEDSLVQGINTKPLDPKESINALYTSKLKYLVKYLIEHPNNYPGGFIRN